MSAGPPAGDAVRLMVFTDLDDTLFQTARKMPGGAPDAPPVAQAKNGQHSYQTPLQAALTGWLSGGAAAGQTIPVTARGTDAFWRVALRFGGPAVVANGAVILGPDGTPDPAWRSRVDARLAPHRATVAALPGAALAAGPARGMGVRAWAVEEPGIGATYAVVKAEPGTDEARLAELEGLLAAAVGPAAAAAWTVHRNGNNLAFIPPAFSKAEAVAHLLAAARARGPVLAIGVGDSATDLPFMRLCDLWMTPAASQIDGLLPGSLAGMGSEAPHAAALAPAAPRAAAGG
ncbi:MAG: trehalose phosphatase [Pseudomonadota bacterium]